jgi:hypothetical protein
MDRSRFIRGLRIAWSVGWGIITVLLVALWVRSYSWRDEIKGPVTATHGTWMTSYQGRLRLITLPNVLYFPSGWKMQSLPPSGTTSWIQVPSRTLGFDITITDKNYFLATAPHWFIILISATLCAAPWVRWRYSLRTMLIAATLATIGLGLVVAFRR